MILGVVSIINTEAPALFLCKNVLLEINLLRFILPSD